MATKNAGRVLSLPPRESNKNHIHLSQKVLVIDGILFEMMKRKFRLAHNWTKEKERKKGLTDCGIVTKASSARMIKVWYSYAPYRLIQILLFSMNNVK